MTKPTHKLHSEDTTEKSPESTESILEKFESQHSVQYEYLLNKLMGRI